MNAVPPSTAMPRAASPVGRPLAAERRRGWMWARREIAALDPSRDDERIVQLMNEVRFGWPPLAAAFYTVAFARQVAVPSIARTLHRGGRSPVFTQPRKRNDDTLVFFAEYFRHGHSSERGRAAVDRMQEIHGHFRIENDDYLYTLTTIITEGARAGALIGLQPMTWAEREANARFWARIGEHMHLDGVPGSYDEAHTFVTNYERDQWGHTAAGEAVATAVIDDYLARWVPPRLHALAFRAFTVILGPELRAVHHYPDPPAWLERTVLLALRTYLRALRVLPDRRARPLTEAFGEYGACPHLADVGYEPASSNS